MAKLPAHMGRRTTGEWSPTPDGLTRDTCGPQALQNLR
jgi:hypothetical protein